MLDLAPFAHRPQHEHRDDRRAGRSNHGADGCADGGGVPAVAGALEIDEAVPDQRPGRTSHADGDEGGKASGGGGESRQGAVGLGAGHGARSYGGPTDTLPVVTGDLRPLIVLPTYDEAENIVEVLRRIRAALPAAEVLVVDDGSPDGTAELARSEGDALGRVHVLQRSDKRGLGAAYLAGFAWGLERGFGVLVEMDADLSHDPGDLPALVGAVTVVGADLAVGSRYVPGGHIPDWPWRRRFLSRWGNRYAAGVLGLAINDATSGFRAYRAEVLRAIELDRIRAEGYAFQVELAYRVIRRGGRVVEVPIVFRDRVRGTSKMSWHIIGEAMALVALWGVRDRVLTRRGRIRVR